MIFNCKDAAAELMKVALFSKANKVVFSGFVVFPSLLLMQQQFLSVVKAWVGEMSHAPSVSMEMIAHGMMSCDFG